jgi:hypothetical protein
MHFTSITTALILATAVSALPSSLAKRVDAIPLAIYSRFGISPIVSGNTDSGIIDQTLLKTLPKGCTRKLGFRFGGVVERKGMGIGLMVKNSGCVFRLRVHER